MQKIVSLHKPPEIEAAEIALAEILAELILNIEPEKIAAYVQQKEIRDLQQVQL